MVAQALKRAAAAALSQFPRAESTDGHLERLTIDVRVGDQREMVSLRLSGDKLLSSCTCTAPQCQHLRAALSALVEQDHAGGDQGHKALFDSVPPGEQRSAPESDRPERADKVGLAEALEDVVTAVVRVGIQSKEAPSIFESLERLVSAAPEPLPVGIGRWVGRLGNALAIRNVDAVARMLDGAARLADDLRSTDPDPDARQRMVAWLGALLSDATGVYQISDRTMIELGREFLDGVDRGGIERRHLLDLDSGHIYREERIRGRPVASLGTCPRVIHVGLAEVERAVEPRRIRLLQYVSVPVVTPGHWGSMRNWAVRTFARIPERYCEAMDAFPGLAEPFMVVLPDGYLDTSTPSLVDEGGHTLPLTAGEESGVLQCVDERTEGAAPSWMAGRLVDAGGVITLRPVSMGLSHHGQMEHVRF